MPATLRPLSVLVLSWVLTGLSAVLVSMLGARMGKTALFAGAILGGFLGVVLAVGILKRLTLLPPDDTLGALLGGFLGFAIAAPIAATNLHNPVTPVVSTSLVGICMLLGIGFARGWRRS